MNQPTANQQRHTAYKYSKSTGQLEKVAAVRAEGFTPQGDVDWDAVGGKLQVTQYVYDALVESSSNGVYDHVTTNGAWISAVHYPDPVTGQPEAEPSVRFTYRFDGQPARRTDGRGVELVYGYDERDRLGSITVAAAPDSGLLAVNTYVANRLEYAHTSDGLLSAARVKGYGGDTRSECTFSYGKFRQLTSATQDVPGWPAKTVTYAWDVPSTSSGTGGYRLLGITYPADVGLTLDFAYGASSGDIDDALNRLTAVTLDGAPLASWRYMGLGRQVGAGLGNGMSMDYDDGAGGPVNGLDTFGRVIDVPWGAGGGILQYQYGYDERGNRLFRRALGPPSAVSFELEDSWLYGYDDLSRLTLIPLPTLVTAGRGGP